MLHGGAVAALLAQGFEAAAREVGLRPVRLGVDLFRPVPAKPLLRRSRTLRRGRRLALLESVLHCEGRAVARGSALLLDDGSPPLVPEGSPPEGPEHLEDAALYPAAIADRVPPGFHRHLAIRFGVHEGEPLLWVHPQPALFHGVGMTPLVVAAASADLVYAATVLPALHAQNPAWGSDGRLGKPYINADTTLYLERPPAGEWMALKARPLVAHGRCAVVEVSVFDTQGRLGSATQALLENPSPGESELQPRGPASPSSVSTKETRS